MPEICEVEIVRSQLSKIIDGACLEAVRVSGKPLKKSNIKEPSDVRSFLGKPIRMERWAKHLYFSTPEWKDPVLYSHLGMSGAWLYARSLDSLKKVKAYFSSLGATLDARHCVYELDFTNGLTLLYYDARRFGDLSLIEPEWETPEERDKLLYPRKDILHPDFDLQLSWVKRPNTREIYRCLHDQEVFPGMGAYLGAEWLFRCGVHPLWTIREILERKPIPEMREHLRKLLHDMSLTGGASISSYYNAEGERGASQRIFSVYGREGEECYACGTLVTNLKGLRGSQHCPTCQPPL